MNAATKPLALIIAAAAVLAPPAGFSALANCRDGAPEEILRIRVVNDHGGEVSVSRDSGASWRVLGRVLRYT